MGVTAGLEELRRLYEEYIVEAREARAKLKYFEGVFGFGRKSSDDPCHSRFMEAFEELMNAVAAEGLDSAELREMLAYIYRAPAENREPQAVYWMFMAVHGLTLELAGQLSREDAEALWSEYRKVYPRWERLPAQKKVLSALDAARK